MLKRTFISCTVVISLIGTSYLCASQPETEFTVPAAPPAPEASPTPEASTVTKKIPAAVTRQSPMQDAKQAFALRMQKIRAANADDEETEDESASQGQQQKGNEEAELSQVKRLEGKVRDLEAKVSELEELLKIATANESLNELDDEARELEQAELQERIKLLTEKLLQAEKETQREKTRQEAQLLAEQENSQIAVQTSMEQAKRAFAIREEELVSKLATTTESHAVALAQLEARIKALQTTLSKCKEELETAQRGYTAAENALKEELRIAQEARSKAEKALQDLQTRTKNQSGKRDVEKSSKENKTMDVYLETYIVAALSVMVLVTKVFTGTLN